MAKASKKYYWDTCCFIAWITGKGHPKEVIDGLDDVAKEVTDGRAILCTSVMTDTEILEGQLTPEQTVKFQDLFKRKNVVQITIDQRIAHRAKEIRDYYNQKGIKIKTPDATHLATALIYGVDEFHTLDGSGERQRPSDLLRLNGDVAGHPLHIRMPVTVQGKLFNAPAAPKPSQQESKGSENNVKSETAEPSTTPVSGGSDGLAASEAAATNKEKKPEEKSKGEIEKGPPSL